MSHPPITNPPSASVRIALHTPLPDFANDLCDILKLFFCVEAFGVHSAAANGRAADPQTCRSEDAHFSAELLCHTFFAEADAVWHCGFSFRGMCISHSLPIPVEMDPERRAIVEKRFKKRLCKMTLYDLLKQYTGTQPPWGSLTGVRPTCLVYENLAQGMSLNDSVAAVVADFDVLPEKAELLRRIVRAQQTLPLPAVDEVDVYISIPFCRTRCTYCSFPGEAIGSGAHAQDYLNALLAEMQAAQRIMQQSGVKLRTVYIGGGTPTALCEADFERLIAQTGALFPDPCEWTVEAGRPDTITRAKLETLARYGVNRISINPQTMNDRTLALIGRDHTALQTIQAFMMAREMGFSNINMDLIAGLPSETEADFAHTLQEIIKLAPDSLTVHTLAIKRSSRLDLQRTHLPDVQTATRMVALGEECAASLAMAPYYLYRQKYMAGQQQNVGYARKDAACLYNVDIMEENTSIVAVGAGAISKRVFPNRELRIERAPNVSNVAIYTDRVQEMIRRKETLFFGRQEAGGS